MDGRVIALVYEAAVNPARWPAALEAFALASGGIAAHLIVLDKNPAMPRLCYLGGPGLAPDFKRPYFEYYHQLDPLIPAVLETPPSTRVMLCHDYVSEAVAARSEYYQDYVIPSGARYLAGWKLESTDTRATALALHAQRAPFDRERAMAWESVAWHARRAVSLTVQLTDRPATTLSLQEAIDRKGIACIMVDGGVQVIECSAAAARLLDWAGPILLDHRSKLSLRRESDTHRLQD